MPHRQSASRTLAGCLVAVARPAGMTSDAAPGRNRRWWMLTEATGGDSGGEADVPGQQVRSEELARLEAAMFLAREPLTTRRLAKLARLADGSRARVLLKELRRLQDAAGSSFRVEHIAGGYQLLTRGPFGPWVRRLVEQPSSSRLSGAALETLAIVAYRQPVTRAEIEAIRGVGSEEMLRQLLDRDFVAVGGRAEDLGRPNVYATTRRFLAAFGLSSLDDLPAVDVAPRAVDQGDVPADHEAG